MLVEISRPGDSNRIRTSLNYAIAVLHLERHLRKRSEMLSVIASRLQHAGFNHQHFESDPQAIAASIAAIYQDTLSTLSFRIQVQGNPLHLSDKYTADRIRALLLAAVRAARLWRQHGGSRLGLLFGRKRIQVCAQEFLSSIH
jgi:high frequency lysogenization protein